MEAAAALAASEDAVMGWSRVVEFECTTEGLKQDMARQGQEAAAAIVARKAQLEATNQALAAPEEGRTAALTRIEVTERRVGAEAAAQVAVAASAGAELAAAQGKLEAAEATIAKRAEAKEGAGQSEATAVAHESQRHGKVDAVRAFPMGARADGIGVIGAGPWCSGGVTQGGADSGHRGDGIGQQVSESGERGERLCPGGGPSREGSHAQSEEMKPQVDKQEGLTLPPLRSNGGVDAALNLPVDGQDPPPLWGQQHL